MYMRAYKCMNNIIIYVCYKLSHFDIVVNLEYIQLYIGISLLFILFIATAFIALILES